MARLIADVAEALEHAHGEGIIHRDIKPSNILLDRDGKAWITDFGLAHMRGDGTLTLSGDILGTARYMSPEQATGQTVIDQRTDVYSLGVTLYELLTLRPAFDGSDHRVVLRAVVEKDPLPPRRVDTSVPADLETIVLKATAKMPDARYHTAGELADDLRRFLGDKPVKARRTGQVTRLRRWARRNPLLAGSLTLVFLLLTALAAGGVVSSVYLARQNELAEAKLYVAAIAQAELAIDQGDHLAAERHLSPYVDRSGQDDPRGFEWYTVWDQCHREGPAMILSHGFNVFSAAYSPNEKLIATTEFYGSINLWDATTGKPVRRIGDHRGWLNRIQFPSDGSQLVAGGRDCRLCVWDATSGDLDWSTLIGPDGVTITDLGMSRASRLVAAGYAGVLTTYPTDEPGGLEVWDVEAHRKRLGFTSLVGKVSVTFSPNGRLLAAASLDGRLYVWDTGDWRLVHSAQAHKAGIYALAFSPDSITLATGSGVWHEPFVIGEVKLWNVKTWQVDGEVSCGAGQVRSMAYSPVAECPLAVGTYDGVISLVDRDQRRVCGEITAHAGIVLSLAFSPNGQRLLSSSSDNTARVWPVCRLQRNARHSPYLAGTYIEGVAFVDDDRVWVVDKRDTLRLIDLQPAKSCRKSGTLVTGRTT
jgi:WD40 repeat protein